MPTARAATILLFDLLCPPVAVAFHSPINYYHPSCVVSRPSNHRRHHQAQQLHYDDFDLTNNDCEIVVDSFDLINGEAVNGSSSSSQTPFPRLHSALTSPPISYPPNTSSAILHQFESSGFVDDNDIVQFAKGFVSQQEDKLSAILIGDFGWKALDAHRARVGLVALATAELQLGKKGREEILLADDELPDDTNPSLAAPALPPPPAGLSQALSVGPKTNAVEGEEGKDYDTTNSTTQAIFKPAPWKSVLVNDKAKIRRAKKDTEGESNTNSDKGSMITKDSYNYGLLQATSKDQTDRKTYTNLYDELDNYWSYMTIPQTSAVADAPIREQTAKVYLTHARLFLGWIVDARGVLVEGSDVMLDVFLRGGVDGGEEGAGEEEKPLSSSPLGSLSGNNALINAADSVRMQTWQNVLKRTSPASNGEDNDHLKQSISLYDIFPTSQTESASPILQYVLWLRNERGISPNYEANILRGLIKLVKFRFAREMSSSPLSNQPSSEKNVGGTNTYATSTRSTPLDSLPIVVELRKLHREAGNKGKKAPRSSDEGKKWLEWSEFLQVIQLLKSDLGKLIDNYNKQLEMEEKSEQSPAKAKKSLNAQRKSIATVFQQYLILSFFACVPDRQRTYRELQLGRNFIKVDDQEVGSSMWVIKHTAEDYKTGATYGERPPLPLTASLTPEIDDFIDQWRSALDSSTADNPSPFLFLQPRTGNPLTANSVYQIVSRCCYKYKQKKTNPHLLRDMIVTHVRQNGDASEKELEALALFMGHSISMQRESYDRRTLEQKVSPAVKLMQNMNSLGADAKE